MNLDVPDWDLPPPSFNPPQQEQRQESKKRKAGAPAASMAEPGKKRQALGDQPKKTVAEKAVPAANKSPITADKGKDAKGKKGGQSKKPESTAAAPSPAASSSASYSASSSSSASKFAKNIVSQSVLKAATNPVSSSASNVAKGAVSSAASKPQLKATKRLDAMKKRLSGGRFRHINELLYTTTGSEAFDLFQREPDLFEHYHEGFRSQVELWPENPVDHFIATLRKVPKGSVIADMGCGEAVIAYSLKNTGVVVHSFDLVAGNELITACDISNVPLESGTVDIVIFCLSLMGTNFKDFIQEANRILKKKGLIKIAEVKSRFEDLDAFIEDVKQLGFSFVSKDDQNKMFVLLDFKKVSDATGKTSHEAEAEANPVLKPCIYKKR